MTEEQQTLEAIKQAINSLPLPHRTAVYECAGKITGGMLIPRTLDLSPWRWAERAAEE